MEMFLIFALGLIVGALVVSVRTRSKPIGTLQIDNSDVNEEPYLFVRLSTSIDNLFKMKVVQFKVDVKDFIPRK